MSRLSLVLQSSATQRWTESARNDGNAGCSRGGAERNQTRIGLVHGLRRQTEQRDRSNEEHHSPWNEAVDGEDHQVREGMWLLVGVSFVQEGARYGHVYNEEGSWYQRYGPEAECKKWVVRIPTVDMMEEGKVQLKKLGPLNIQQSPS